MASSNSVQTSLSFMGARLSQGLTGKRAPKSEAGTQTFLRFALLCLVAMLACCLSPQGVFAQTEEPIDYPKTLIVEAVGMQSWGCSNTESLSAGKQVTLQIPRFVAADLKVEHNPRAILVGIDCGMPGMCGIDPCLCGSSDHWGHCSCNGLREVIPTVQAVSGNEAVVRIEQADAGVRLVPVAPGKATITMVSSLDNYQDVESVYEVEVGGLMTADIIAIAGCALLVVLVLVVVMLMLRRRKRAISATGVAMLLLAFVLVPCGLGLSSCGSVKVDESSPQVKAVTMKSSSTGTEASQRVEVKVEFDQQIAAGANVLSDLAVTLNGKEIDASAMKLSLSPSATAITLTLSPTDAASTGKGSLFAVYQGQISIKSQREDGAVPSLTSASGSAAVIKEPIAGLLSSGLTVEVIDQTVGSVATNTLAQTTFKVTSPAVVRAITWFSPDGGATKILKHNHTFLKNDAAACAEDLAKVVNAANCGVTATARGDEVTLRALEVKDGQRLDPVVVEGVGATPGAFDDSMVETSS